VPITIDVSKPLALEFAKLQGALDTIDDRERLIFAAGFLRGMTLRVEARLKDMGFHLHEAHNT
jgi:hypothetical protein